VAYYDGRSETDWIPMKDLGTWLTILGVAGLWMTLAPTDTGAEPAVPISSGSTDERRDHFGTPIEAVVAFLAAVKFKDAVRLISSSRSR
jgi:hypothetical protein